MKPDLTLEEKINLLKRHKSEPSHKAADRIKAVLLSNDGMNHREIASVLFINEETVGRHIQDYITKAKLQNESGGSTQKLTASQTSDLITHLERCTYTNSKEIITHINQTYHIQYSHSGMVDWLHQHGFSYKKPAQVPGKADPILQEDFIDSYKKLKLSLPDDAVICFGDAVHPTMQTKISSGWIRTGKNKQIQTTASRTRINIFGAINLESMKFTHATYDTINSDSICNFLELLRMDYPGKKIHLILDQGSYNKSEATLKKAESLDIEIHLLPPYSPNLNAIERVWLVMNEIARNNIYFKSAKDFKESVLGFFATGWQLIKEEMRTRINDNFQRLKIDILP